MTSSTSGPIATGDQRPSIVDVLQRARELITDENNWCQGVYALNRHGRIVNVEDRFAVRFCMNGALARAAGLSINEVEKGEIMRHLRPFLNGNNLHFAHRFNDDHTHAEVLAAFDKAIASIRERETPITGGNGTQSQEGLVP